VKPETTAPAVTRHCENVRHNENEAPKKHWLGTEPI